MPHPWLQPLPLLSLFSGLLGSLLLYGILRSDLAVAVANGVTFGLVLILVGAKFMSRPEEPLASQGAR